LERRNAMKAADIMTPKVLSVDPDTPILEAMQLMLVNGVSGLPVIDQHGSLVGIVTEGDFLRRVETGTEKKRPKWLELFVGPGRLAEDYVHTHGRRVGEVMTPDPFTIAEDTRLEDVVDSMERHRIKRMPVVREGRVVGIVSRADLLHALARLVRTLAASPRTDEDIRKHVLWALAAEAWVPKSFIEVEVHDGVVELQGRILDERERQALRVVVENVPGVKAVKDHLVWVEPMSGMTFGSPDDTVARPKISPGCHA
jgi:CBS domain-containing protein